MPRYAAFISYSHADADVARWLHHGLETYRFPRQLIGTETPFGPVARRLEPIFRDREELPAAGDLGDKLRDALVNARHLIVICSPRSAKSQWVNEEVRFFKAHHGADKVLALIASGEPGHAELECFPPALKYKLDADGQVSDVPAEPIAADIRPGKDGKRLARLKLLAGLSGLPLDQLARRDVQRRQQRLVWVATAASLIAVMTAGLAIYANQQRIEATRQRDIAQSSLDFLVGTFEIANPATENPRTITAITVLDRASKRAAGELGDKPEVAARLLRTTGQIFANLGLPAEAEADLRKALALTPEKGEARAEALLQLARIAIRKGDSGVSEAYVAQAEKILPTRSASASALRASAAEVRGYIAYLKLDLDASNAQLDRAAQLYRAAPEDHRADIARVRMNQGQALVQARQFGEADRSLAEAEQLLAQRFGSAHVRTALATHNRAFGKFEAGDTAAAAVMIDRAVERYNLVLEPNHPWAARSRALRGRIKHRLGDLDGAAAELSAAQAIYSELYGPTHYEAAGTGYFLARVLSDLGRYGEALAVMDASKRAYDINFGPVDPDQVELLEARALVLRAAGRLEESSRDCSAALKMRAQIDLADKLIAERTRWCTALALQPPGIDLRFEPVRSAQPGRRRT